jgi:hypothetical protein
MFSKYYMQYSMACCVCQATVRTPKIGFTGVPFPYIDDLAFLIDFGLATCVHKIHVSCRSRRLTGFLHYGRQIAFDAVAVVVA